MEKGNRKEMLTNKEANQNYQRPSIKKLLDGMNSAKARLVRTCEEVNSYEAALKERLPELKARIDAVDKERMELVYIQNEIEAS